MHRHTVPSKRKVIIVRVVQVVSILLIFLWIWYAAP